MSLIQLSKKYTRQIKKEKIRISEVIQDLEGEMYGDGSRIKTNDVVAVLKKIKRGLGSDEYFRGEGMAHLIKINDIIDRYIDDNYFEGLDLD